MRKALRLYFIFAIPVALVFALSLNGCKARSSDADSLQFSISISRELEARPASGRVMVIITKNSQAEPRYLIDDDSALFRPFIVAADVADFAPGDRILLDRKSYSFPLASLGQIPAGFYQVQAVFRSNPEINDVDAPGNLFSAPERLYLNPHARKKVRLVLSGTVEEELPIDTDYLKYVKIRSRLLTAFNGRPTFLKAGVVLPRDYYHDPGKKYPLWIHIGGEQSSYTDIQDLIDKRPVYTEIAGFRSAWLSGSSPRVILLHLDNYAGPFGCSYHVNSDNNGPYGDAITRELIPYVEKEFRAIGTHASRFVQGYSTGGWAALALQIFYPDFFNGVWAESPDPVDFRAFENINIYDDRNAFDDPSGNPKASARDDNGEIISTVREEIQFENVLGSGNIYTRSGRSWGAWNAAFGPRGPEGFPLPLIDPQTGIINPGVSQFFRKYDLRLYLEQHWQELASKLDGKMHISVGKADTYFLNNAVGLLDDFLKNASPPVRSFVLYGEDENHSWFPYSARDLLRQMDERLSQAQ